jgi:hypothetical protein
MYGNKNDLPGFQEPAPCGRNRRTSINDVSVMQREMSRQGDRRGGVVVSVRDEDELYDRP